MIKLRCKLKTLKYDRVKSDMSFKGGLTHIIPWAPSFGKGQNLSKFEPARLALKDGQLRKIEELVGEPDYMEAP